MRIRAAFVVFLFVLPQISAAQQQAAWAARVNGTTPLIDGRMDEPVWADARPVSDFRQKNPVEGAPASELTEVRFLATDRDLFVGIRAFDRETNRIYGPLVRRDQAISSDFVDVFLDTYHDRRTSFQFGVNPSGARRDVFIYDDGARRDDSWDPVYDWATHIDSLGWSAELRIPLSQLRFPHRDSLTFGLRLTRSINRRGEESNWPFVPRDQAGEVSRYGELKGLAELPAPRRVELLPYTAGSRRFVPAAIGNPLGSESRLRTGGDLKLGVTSGLTLDGTITPDFGQVEADPAVVNLTGFETFFAEKRPFFVEGTDLFRFTFSASGDEGLVYTRRIGRSPQLGASGTFVDMPTETTILGAAKLTGQIGKGWALGVAQAVTSRENASLLASDGTVLSRAGVEPLTNYSVVRLRRTTRQGRLAYGAIATGLVRSLNDPVFDPLHKSAFSGGLEARGRFGKDAYEFESRLMGTRVQGSPAALLRTQTSTVHAFQRPDQTHIRVDPARTSLGGFGAFARVARVTGFATWYARFTMESPGLEPNDLGFLRRTDLLQSQVWGSLRWLKPGRAFRRIEWSGWNIASETFGWERNYWELGTRIEATLPNYWGFNVSYAWEPSWIDNRLLRGGPAVLAPPHSHVNGGISSDSRRPLQAMLSWSTTFEHGTKGNWLVLNGGFMWRPPGPVALSVSVRRPWGIDEGADRAYVTRATVGGLPYYVVGRAMRREISLVFRTDLTLSPRLSFQVYAQPFASAIAYTNLRLVSNPRAARYADRFDVLGTDRMTRPGNGTPVTVDLNRDGVTDFSFAEPDRRVLSLRTNAVLRWEFRPGSTLFVVWQQNRNDQIANGSLAALHDLGETFSATGMHVLAIKLTYWIGL
ncbi:MAG: carbohydrate binding family 9 domain-containing protein [Gemmatimonadetes bacterium]|nr:carbohydrate binding family 9 domain-containing protein [Gemmatimonadota bacterium]